MKKTNRLQVIAVGMVALLFAGGNAAFSNESLVDNTDSLEAFSEQPEFPLIKRQPADQGVWLGSNVTFSVKAENGDGYQWVRNGVVLSGQTNSTLTIEQTTIEDVGLYTAYVFKGEEAVPTRSASLNVYSMSSGTYLVYAVPASSSGSQGSCPGAYAGYANYVKPTWGWVPSTGTTIHTATDPNRTDTFVTYTGRYGDTGCAQTTVTVPAPTTSPKYRFTIFFPNNVPTNSYALELDGFDP